MNSTPTQKLPTKMRVSTPGAKRSQSIRRTSTPASPRRPATAPTAMSLAGAKTTATARYIITIGSSRPICNAPSAAISRNTTSNAYFR